MSIKFVYLSRQRDLSRVAGHLVVVWLLAFGSIGCKTSGQTEITQVTVPRMSGPALRELIAYKMRTHDWRLVRNTADLMVFEKAEDESFAALWDIDRNAQKLVRAHISLTDVNDGVALRAIGQRVDVGKGTSGESSTHARELRRILEEVRHVSVSQTTISR